MGFLNGLLGFAGVAGMLYMYKAKYNDYDDEDLFDEYVRLFKAVRFGYSDNEEDAIRFSAVKEVMGERDLF